MHVPLVCSQHSFGLPPIMHGIQRMQSDQRHLDLLSHGTINKKLQQSVLPALPSLWLLLLNATINNLYCKLVTCNVKNDKIDVLTVTYQSNPAAKLLSMAGDMSLAALIMHLSAWDFLQIK